MKKTILIASCALLSLGALAQDADLNAGNERAAQEVLESIDNPQVLDQVYGIMVARLDEHGSEHYQGGVAEIPFSDMIERIANSSQEIEITDANGELHQFTIEPSLNILDDNHTAPAPVRITDENVIQYLNRLAELTTLDTEHHDYIVIATTGGEQGMSFSRVNAGEANGLNELNETIQVSIFPNPVTDAMTITGLPLGNFPAALLDVQGKKVMDVTASENKQIDLSGLSAGFYTLSISLEDTVITEKIQVKK